MTSGHVNCSLVPSPCPSLDRMMNGTSGSLEWPPHAAMRSRQKGWPVSFLSVALWPLGSLWKYATVSCRSCSMPSFGNGEPSLNRVLRCFLNLSM